MSAGRPVTTDELVEMSGESRDAVLAEVKAAPTLYTMDGGEYHWSVSTAVSRYLLERPSASVAEIVRAMGGDANSAQVADELEAVEALCDGDEWFANPDMLMDEMHDVLQAAYYAIDANRMAVAKKLLRRLMGAPDHERGKAALKKLCDIE